MFSYTFLIVKWFHVHTPTSFLTIIMVLDLGLRQPRLEGDEYLSIVDEFMEAARTRWPKAVIQV